MPSPAELREFEDEELETRLSEYRRELLNLRFQLATGQLDNVSRIREVKKDVARVLSLLRDREIALAEGRDAGPVMRDVVLPPKPKRPSRREQREAEAAAAEGEEFEDELDDAELEDVEVEDQVEELDDEDDAEEEEE